MRLRVIEFDRLEDLVSPVVAVVDDDLVDMLLKAPLRLHRNGDPEGAVARANAVAIFEMLLLELHVIDDHVYVAQRQFVEKTEPGQKLGLMAD